MILRARPVKRHVSSVRTQYLHTRFCSPRFESISVNVCLIAADDRSVCRILYCIVHCTSIPHVWRHPRRKSACMHPQAVRQSLESSTNTSLPPPVLLTSLCQSIPVLSNLASALIDVDARTAVLCIHSNAHSTACTYTIPIPVRADSEYQSCPTSTHPANTPALHLRLRNYSSTPSGCHLHSHRAFGQQWLSRALSTYLSFTAPASSFAPESFARYRYPLSLASTYPSTSPMAHLYPDSVGYDAIHRHDRHSRTPSLPPPSAYRYPS